MTGAKIPRGCGKIIRIEYTRQDEKIVFLETKEPLQNIIFKGENIKTGERVLEPRRLSPGDIGIEASLGVAAMRPALFSACPAIPYPLTSSLKFLSNI
jgi:molybdopterin biosynthesis enzyme